MVGSSCSKGPCTSPIMRMFDLMCYAHIMTTAWLGTRVLGRQSPTFGTSSTGLDSTGSSPTTYTHAPPVAAESRSIITNLSALISSSRLRFALGTLSLWTSLRASPFLKTMTPQSLQVGNLPKMCKMPQTLSGHFIEPILTSRRLPDGSTVF